VVDDFKWRRVAIWTGPLKRDKMLEQQDFVIFHLLTYVVH